MSDDRRTYARYAELGQSARLASKGLDANPYRDKPSMRKESAAWEDGWRRANAGPGRADMALRGRR